MTPADRHTLTSVRAEIEELYESRRVGENFTTMAQNAYDRLLLIEQSMLLPG
jgi:hypothetical protein